MAIQNGYEKCFQGQSPLEREALEFIEKLHRIYLEERDLEALLRMMDARIVWMGSGLKKVCVGLDDAMSVLLQEFARYPGRFIVKNNEYRSEGLSENVCLVYGYLSADPVLPESVGMDIRLTAVCIRTAQGMRLLHLNLSQMDGSGEKADYLSKLNIAGNNALRRRTDETYRQLEEQNRELAALSQNIPGGIQHCVNDVDFALLEMSEGFLELTGYTRQEVRERFRDRLAEMILPEDLPGVYEEVRNQLETSDTVELEYRIRCKDNRVLWILDRCKADYLPDGRQGLYCLMLDITQQHNEREALRLSLERHQIIMDQATDIIFEWDIRKDTLLFSANWRKKFGYEPIEEKVSQRIPLSDNIHPEDMPAFIRIMREQGAGLPYSETEFRIRDVCGNFVWCRVRATAQFNGKGKAIKAVGVIVDIDEEKRQKQHLLEQAQHDPLTGLYNKSTARQRVETSLSQPENRRGVLLIIDLDDFKGINDRYGHLCGDAALSDMASVLKRLFRSTDVVARIGGDEFLVWLPGVPAENMEVKTRQVIQKLKELTVCGKKGLISCSIGAAVYPKDAQDFLGLYRCADIALYYRKSIGKNGFAFYEPSLQGKTPDRGALRTAIGAAIDSDSGMVKERLGQYCFRMLYNAAEPMKAVKQILEIVGRAYDVSRVYIVEASEDDQTYNRTLEWCNTGVIPLMEEWNNVPYHSALENYEDNFDAGGIFYCGDIRELKPGLYELLEQHGLCSLLQCAIVEEGRFEGYVGFDECREERQWTRGQMENLTLVANVLSTFLIKYRLKERLARLINANDNTGGADDAGNPDR